jgi:tripartite-type tricarboxylate transporter receptor subunit TctC
MKKQMILLLMVCLILALFVRPHETLSAPYYEGKILNIVVAFPPGGGYDRMARLLAKHLPKHIPGKPHVIVQNIPGASSIVGTNYLYSMAKPDGLTIGTFNRGLVFAQLLKQEGVRFDLAKFPWIGSPSIEATVLTVRSDLPYKAFDQVLKSKDPLIYGHTGPANNNYQFAAPLMEFAGLKTRMVGYPGTGDIWLALERKEIEGTAAANSSSLPLVARGLLRPLLRGRVPEPGIENLPVNEDFTTNKTGKTVMAIISAQDLVGRPYVAPPGTKPEIMEILRTAFDRVTKDPEAKAESEKVLMGLSYVTAEKSMEVTKFVLNQPPEIVKELNKYIRF